MAEFIEKLKILFEELQSKDISLDNFRLELRTLLNDTFNKDSDFKPVECLDVYISKPENDPFFAIVIPEMPTNGGSILKIDYIYKYYVDIDIEHFSTAYNKYGLNPSEMAAWFVHELLANVFSDTTFLRYKKLLIRYYDSKNQTIVSAHNNLGYLSWFKVFGNTDKAKINEMSSGYVANYLNMFDLAHDWNTALSKYIVSCGGDWNMIMPNKVAESDKEAIEYFSKFARKYSTYTVKYANRDWKNMVTYLCANVGSELLKKFITIEPEQVAAIPEKSSWLYFDTGRSLREDVEEIAMDTPTEDKAYQDQNILELSSSLSELELDIRDINCGSEKLLFSAKLKDLLVSIEKKIAEDPMNQSALELKERAYQLVKTLTDDIHPTEVTEIEIS